MEPDVLRGGVFDEVFVCAFLVNCFVGVKEMGAKRTLDLVPAHVHNGGRVDDWAIAIAFVISAVRSPRRARRRKTYLWR